MSVDMAVAQNIHCMHHGSGEIWVAIKIMVPFWVPQTLGAALY